MYTLGINAAFHDSAACLVEDGRIIAAAEEERFTGIKHGKRPIPFSTYEVPFHAIDYCLREADIHLGSVDHVAYSFDPHILTGPLSGVESIRLPLEPSRASAPENGKSPWDDLFLASIVNAPRHLNSGFPHHLQQRLSSAGHHYQWHFVDHHLCHAVSAFFPSPFREAAVMAIDGRGERATTSYWMGTGSQLSSFGAVELPSSLGLLYERVTSHLGFLHSSDEYKVMALASFGKPTFVDYFRGAIDVTGAGQYRIDPLDLTEVGSERQRGEPFEQWHFDLARSVQVVLEETVLQLCDWLQAATGAKNLCLAGGVALNCVMNSKIRDSGIFDHLWIQPAAGDAGTALGAALWIDNSERDAHAAGFTMETAYLGPEFDECEIETFLRSSKLSYRRSPNLPEEVAGCLFENKIAGWFQGRMEFGPRALGSRSILASPLDPLMQARLNDIKDREDFRPVAPVVLEEEAQRWFKPASISPFMLFIDDILPDARSRIPAVSHVDGTARIQTIRRDQNSLYYDLIRAFQRRSEVPILVNTSFNTRGKPIVCAPRDAIECFMTSPIDVLAIGPFLLEK